MIVSAAQDVRPLEVADLFCGAGGSSTGLAQACDELNVEYSLTAVNHWDVAIATHAANHPTANHLRAEVDKLEARALSERGYLDILWASPACTEHSYAKGGHNIDDQKRHSAWAIPREAERYRPKIVIVENVPPFRNWGPTEPVFHENGRPKLDKKGEHVYRPIKKRKGETYRAWFSAIESLGYDGRADLLNAADYGEPQSRIRLFMVFTMPGIAFEWPQPEFGAPGSLEVAAGQRKTWRGAREILNRSYPMGSIFERDKPLAENTLRRIAVGAQRFWGDPYLVILRRHADSRGIDLPTPTVAARGQHMGLAQQILRPLVSSNGSHANLRPGQPVPTITAAGARSYQYFEAGVRPLICNGTSGAIPRSDGEPGPTVTAEGYQWTIAAQMRPIVLGQPKPSDEPLGTVVTRDRFGVAEPMIIAYHGESKSGGVHIPRTGADPLNAVCTNNQLALLTPTTEVLDALPVNAPKERIFQGTDGRLYLFDILFRMVQPPELARAQGFPEDYVFTGTKEAQTAQIGNAVPVAVAKALMRQAVIALRGGEFEAAA